MRKGMSSAHSNKTTNAARSKGTAKGVKGTEGAGGKARVMRKGGGTAMKPGKYGSSGFTQKMEDKDQPV